jgi:5'-nucleotidase
MNILVTNDDGINCENMLKLAEKLRARHNVWIVAPAEERSGCSHSINIRNKIVFKKIGHRVYACSGSTADCVLISLLGAISEKIDMVVSGINPGPNLGTDILYSGTAAGARQGALMGRPSVALSAYSRDPYADLTRELDFIESNLELFGNLWTSSHFININFPRHIDDKTGVAITVPSLRTYRDRLIATPGPDGSVSYIVDGDEPGAVDEKGSDFEAVKNNSISVSPVLIRPVLHEREPYKTARFRLAKGECIT